MNLVDEMPEVAARLHKAWRAWEKEIDAEREAQVRPGRRPALGSKSQKNLDFAKIPDRQGRIAAATVPAGGSE